METCSTCKSTTDLEGIFTTKGSNVYCPKCMEERTGKDILGALFRIVLMVTGLLVLAFIGWKGAWFFINIYVSIIFTFFLALPHEAGHALVAKLLGVHVYRIVIGVGSKIASFTLWAPLKIRVS